ncbi:MAG: RHS repeat-associated core domain-containing protein, partial [Bacteroidota bacterium]
NNFLYNGKELQNVLNFNLFDYGARYFDVNLGRFTSIDPLASDYYAWSPYHYAANDPIRMVDIGGMGWGDGIWQTVARAASTAVEFGAGVINAVASNATTITSVDGSMNLFEGIPRLESGSDAFEAGQTTGDVISFVGGVYEMTIGIGTTTAGGVVELGTLGTASPVAIPAVGAGVAMPRMVLIHLEMV